MRNWNMSTQKIQNGIAFDRPSTLPITITNYKTGTGTMDSTMNYIQTTSK